LSFIYLFITTQQKDQATYTVGKSTKRKAHVTCNQ